MRASSRFKRQPSPAQAAAEYSTSGIVFAIQQIVVVHIQLILRALLARRLVTRNIPDVGAIGRKYTDFDSFFNGQAIGVDAVAVFVDGAEMSLFVEVSTGVRKIYDFIFQQQFMAATPAASPADVFFFLQIHNNNFSLQQTGFQWRIVQKSTAAKPKPKI